MSKTEKSLEEEIDETREMLGEISQDYAAYMAMPRREQDGKED